MPGAAGKLVFHSFGVAKESYSMMDIRLVTVL